MKIVHLCQVIVHYLEVSFNTISFLEPRKIHYWQVVHYFEAPSKVCKKVGNKNISLMPDCFQSRWPLSWDLTLGWVF